MKTTSDLLPEIQRQISIENMDPSSTKLLVAVSGGVDSMVLLNILHRLCFPLVVAHVNHQTRGVENEEEETMIKNYCENLGIEFYSNIFTFQKGNFQEEARNFRYKFFRKLAVDHSCRYIATAHHRGDQIETFIQALNRSAGLAGLCGMSILQGDLFRPLLSTTKSDLYEYARAFEIPFREDSSNALDDYQRNLIRNKVIPQIETALPDFQEKAAVSIRILSEAKNLIYHLLRSHPAIEWREGYAYPLSIDLALLPANLELKKTILWYALKCMEVHPSQIEDIIGDHVGPKTFITKKFKIECYQSKLYTLPIEEISINEVKTLNHGIPLELNGGRCLALHYKKPESSHFLLTSGEDLEPFSVRPWKDGDRIKPSGMAGKSKKIKKILQEQKIPQFLRKKIHVLVDRNDEILWIIGLRTSTAFQNEQTKYMYYFSLS